MQLIVVAVVAVHVAGAVQTEAAHVQLTSPPVQGFASHAYVDPAPPLVSTQIWPAWQVTPPQVTAAQDSVFTTQLFAVQLAFVMDPPLAHALYAHTAVG